MLVPIHPIYPEPILIKLPTEKLTDRSTSSQVYLLGLRNEHRTAGNGDNGTRLFPLVPVRVETLDYSQPS